MIDLICLVVASLIFINTRKILKVLRLKKPKNVSITISDGENNMLNFVLNLPAPGAPDVVSRELKVNFGGNDYVEVLSGDSIKSANYLGEDNAVVTVSLVDIDDAGNRSDASESTFTLVDTIAPPAPGAIGLTVVSEDFPSPVPPPVN